MDVGKTIEILKPRTDKREYRRIVLSNSLEVLLISDPETDKAAASMNVGVGSLCDPEGLEGLAHFLEHMLFYSSEKYPLENSYSRHIKEHGGSTNAYTSSDHTNYHFDINSDCFDEAVDRFAQFFICPLISPDATEREIKSVDSENKKNLLSDRWRLNQLEKHLSAKDHPYHKFSTGNKETLEVRPKARGVDTRNELIKFYSSHYSANLMNLVLYGKENLNKLQKMAENNFQKIQNKNLNRFRFKGWPCYQEHLQILVKVVPIMQGHRLTFSWPITPEIHHYKDGPCRYLGHLIGHEGAGSLFYVLKTLGWATCLFSGESSEWTLDYSFFAVTIELTDDGHENVENIVGLLFKYISILSESGIKEWMFNELAAICEMEFHNQDKISPLNYAVHVSSSMSMYPPEDWLATSLPKNFNPSSIKLILDKLTPENVRIFWQSNKFDGYTDRVEPWYGASYSIETLSNSRIQEWIKRSSEENLHLPAPNVFIPTDLTLKEFQEKAKYPKLLRKSSFSRVWYKPNTVFCTPKAYVNIDFHCPNSCQSPEGVVLTSLFTNLLMDYLNEYAYDAQVAGLSYFIGTTKTGFQINIVGYNHKLRVLLDTIIGRITRFEVKPDRFAVIKETLTKGLKNFKFQQPYQQALYFWSLILEDQSWSWDEKLDTLLRLDAMDLVKFYPSLLSRTFLECYVAGNIEANEAESMIDHIEDTFYKGQQPICKPLFPSQHLTNRIVKLEKTKFYLYQIEGLNQSNENSALTHYIQVHQDDFNLNVKLQLLALIAEQPAFDQLRSVEQLGYVVALMHRNHSGIHGIQVIVQSSEKDPSHIFVRVEAYLKMFETKLYELNGDDFKSNVNALIKMKLEKHKNLKEESRFFWREIDNGTYKFDRKEAEVAALKNLTQQELIDFFNEYIKAGAPQRRTLSVQIYGRQHSSQYVEAKDKNNEPDTVRIEDIYGFRRSRPLYGSFKGGSGLMRL